jgi:hypothetical protein
MELVVGKKFKLEVWEKCLKTMWLNEISKFCVIRDVINKLIILFLINLTSVFILLLSLFLIMQQCQNN